jgi:Ca2+-binding EF-hand superfamily protein
MHQLLGSFLPYSIFHNYHDDLSFTISTVTVGQDGNIDKRLQFSARVLTLNGHDARREVNGFFITSDNTIAMYEFRQFGTRSKALPFIQRGAYRHVVGHRKGELIHLCDITVGKNITFQCHTQPSVPESLKNNRKLLTVRITEVDEECKNTLLFDKCANDKDRKEVYDFINFYNTRERTPEVKFLQGLQNSMQEKLGICSEKVLINFFHQLQSFDVSSNGLLKKDLYIQQLDKFRIPIEHEVWEGYWKLVDEQGTGLLDYGEFMRTMFGEMSEQRKVFVRKAFSRLDPNKRGMGELNDIRKYFLPSKHPNVIKGEISEYELLDSFVQCFKCTKRKTEISYSEFEVYYEGVSMGITSDQSFINLLRMTWNI